MVRVLGLGLICLAVACGASAPPQLAGVPHTVVDRMDEMTVAQLDGDATVAGVPFTTGSRLTFLGAGLASAKPGGPCVVGGQSYPAGSSLFFDPRAPQAVLVRAVLGGPTTLGSAELGAGDEVEYRDGRPISAKLAASRTIAGASYDAGDKLALGGSGEVVSRTTASEGKADSAASAADARDAQERAKKRDACTRACPRSGKPGSSECRRSCEASYPK